MVHCWLNTRFVRRLLYFYKPSSKLYAGLALDHSKARQLTVVGCQFVEFLMDSDEVRKTCMDTCTSEWLDVTGAWNILFFLHIRMVRDTWRSWYETWCRGSPHRQG